MTNLTGIPAQGRRVTQGKKKPALGRGGERGSPTGRGPHHPDPPTLAGFAHFGVFLVPPPQETFLTGELMRSGTTLVSATEKGLEREMDLGCRRLVRGHPATHGPG